MNLLYGQLMDVFTGDDGVMGRIRVRGALAEVPLRLVADPRPGDTLLVCDGIALGKVCATTEKETAYVPGHSRKSP